MIHAIITYTFMQNAVMAALLASVVTGIIGAVAIEKNMISMSGGIAHASFGGIGLGYLLGFEPIWGGLAFAVASSALIGKMSTNKKMKTDTLTGILWSFGMALGILFISLAPGYMPDMTSYLFGDILSVSTASLYYMAGFTLAIVLVFWMFYPYFVAYLFDEEYIRTVGIRVKLLKGMVYLIIPVGIIVLIKIVGVILTIALMTIPVSIAKMFFKSFRHVVFASMAASVLFCLVGLTLSYYIEIPSGVCIIVIATIIYLLLMCSKRGVEKRMHERRAHPPH